MTSDRIIFPNICEDRAIEPNGQLTVLLNGTVVCARLRVPYKRAYLPRHGFARRCGGAQRRAPSPVDLDEMVIWGGRKWRKLINMIAMEPRLRGWDV